MALLCPAAEDFFAVLRRRAVEDALEKLVEVLQAPVERGAQIGTVHLTNGEEELQTFSITAAQDVDALSFGYCFWLLVQSLALCDG